MKDIKIIKAEDIKYSVQCIKIPELKQLAKKPYYVYDVCFDYLGYDVVCKGTEYEKVRYHYNIYFGFNNQTKTFSFFNEDNLQGEDYLSLLNTKAFEVIKADHKLMSYQRSKK
jgi:hypothetical protein